MSQYSYFENRNPFRYFGISALGLHLQFKKNEWDHDVWNGQSCRGII